MLVQTIRQIVRLNLQKGRVESKSSTSNLCKLLSVRNGSQKFEIVTTL